MKRILALTFLAAACDREARVERYIEARVPPMPGSDPTIADERLVGVCIRGGAGQVVGKIVRVATDSISGSPVYVVQPPGGAAQVAVPPSPEVPGLITPCG